MPDFVCSFFRLIYLPILFKKNKYIEQYLFCTYPSPKIEETILISNLKLKDIHIQESIIPPAFC